MSELGFEKRMEAISETRRADHLRAVDYDNAQANLQAAQAQKVDNLIEFIGRYISWSQTSGIEPMSTRTRVVVPQVTKTYHTLRCHIGIRYAGCKERVAVPAINENVYLYPLIGPSEVTWESNHSYGSFEDLEREFITEQHHGISSVCAGITESSQLGVYIDNPHGAPDWVLAETLYGVGISHVNTLMTKLILENDKNGAILDLVDQDMVLDRVAELSLDHGYDPNTF